MNDELDQLERRMIAGYRLQIGAYERALCVLENRMNQTNGAPNENARIPALQDALKVVADLDAGLEVDKAEWRHAKREPGTELRNILDQLAKRIKALAEQVDGQVAELLERKQRLVPEMDEFIRQRWMLNAYEKFGQAAKA